MTAARRRRAYAKQDQIRIALEALRISQTDAARQLRVSISCLNKWLLCRVVAPRDLERRIEVALGLPRLALRGAAISGVAPAAVHTERRTARNNAAAQASATQAAVAFLRGWLADGDIGSAYTAAEAARRGITAYSLLRAKARLRVECYRMATGRVTNREMTMIRLPVAA